MQITIYRYIDILNFTEFLQIAVPQLTIYINIVLFVFTLFIDHEYSNFKQSALSK